MRMQKPVSRLLSRTGFESLIDGVWVDQRGGRFRQNGPFKTWVHQGHKYVSDGTNTLRAKSWWEIANLLGLIKTGQGVGR